MNQEEPKTILIIDDDTTIRKLIGFHLKKKEYLTFEAESAQDGFSVLDSQKIDLVLCDVGMERMDGFTFCKKVRENDKYRILPFIFVTAQGSFEDKEKALEAGGDDLITKPFDVNELLLKVQALLRRSEIYKTYGTKKRIEQTVQEDIAKIVLVDDDISLAKLFHYNLTKAGFDCAVANSVEDGLKLVKQHSPDIIISDIMMPEIDGFEFRRRLLKDEELKSIPFIFLTSKGGEEDILEGYDLGITDYVLKTAGPRVVVAKVSAIIKSLGKERQKVVSELHKAADVLRVKVVPENFPSFSGFQVKHWHMPFKGIPGGDFIDYFDLDSDNHAIILGDVMGKKWGAWFFAIAYAGYVRSAIRVALQNSKEYSPKTILQQVNDSVYQDAKISEVFATLSIVTVNNKTNVVKYSGAGDLPIMYKSFEKNTVEVISSEGMLLGFAKDGHFDDSVIQMKENDFIVLITDGIIESRNEEGIALGSDNLAKILKHIAPDTEPMEFLQSQINTFTNNRYEDDVSLITIRAKS